MWRNEGEQRCSVTGEIKAQARNYIAIYIHQKKPEISSCHMWTQGLPPERERPRAAQGTALEGKLGESRCACEGRRGGKAEGEVSGHCDAAVICPRWAAHP